ncbi:MarR family winged helix-turn-helix transcriptional regulator [Methylophilus sp. 14]|uniref:MarR family winged helix-turn-helix transcriptional regulator n=1 Tax=Methylophilus sp. 14 TaxID=2781019 RepID=UPI00188EF8B3|nr:MarR family transcriptional regulator [Methylophilus sp. 14]MBF4988153.1 MarR family transcriptional regulator [Methylophilus sp. 14]
MTIDNFQSDRLNQVGFLIKRVQQAFRAQMDAALATHGLTTSQYAVLAHLRKSPGLSNAELARRSFVTAPTMIRIVQDLEKLEYIARSKNINHLRVVDMSLTDAGKKVIDLCDSKVNAIQEQMLTGMSEEDVSSFTKLLIQCATQLENIS